MARDFFDAEYGTRNAVTLGADQAGGGKITGRLRLAALFLYLLTNNNREHRFAGSSVRSTVLRTRRRSPDRNAYLFHRGYIQALGRDSTLGDNTDWT